MVILIPKIHEYKFSFHSFVLFCFFHQCLNILVYWDFASFVKFIIFWHSCKWDYIIYYFSILLLLSANATRFSMFYFWNIIIFVIFNHLSMVLLWFSVYKIMSFTNKHNFSSLFPNRIFLISFCCLISLAKTSISVVQKWWEWTTLSILIWEKKISTFYHWDWKDFTVFEIYSFYI